LFGYQTLKVKDYIYCISLCYEQEVIMGSLSAINNNSLSPALGSKETLDLSAPTKRLAENFSKNTGVALKLEYNKNGQIVDVSLDKEKSSLIKTLHYWEKSSNEEKRWILNLFMMGAAPEGKVIVKEKLEKIFQINDSLAKPSCV